MARDGSDVYSLPTGSIVSPGDNIEASQHNTPLQDLEQDANLARPISVGGTGATTAGGARTNLQVQPTENPEFTGTGTAVGWTVTGTLTADTITFDGSDLQVLLDAKAPIANPTFTGRSTFAKGTAAEPGISIADTGFFMDGTGGTLRVALAGNEHAVFQGSSFNTSVHTVQTREKADARFVRQNVNGVGDIGFFRLGGSNGTDVARNSTITTSASRTLQDGFTGDSNIFGAVLPTTRPNGEVWRCKGFGKYGAASMWIRVS